MSKSARIWLLVFVVAVAAFFRLYRITTIPPGLYFDEAIDGNNAAEAIKAAPPAGGFKVFYTEDNGREGLYVNIVGALLKVVRVHEPWVIRLPAAIAGILTVLGIYFLAAGLFGAETGLLAAFLLAANFWHINFSRIGFRAILAPLFLVWALYFLMKAYKTPRVSPFFKSGVFYAVIAGAAYGAGFYTYIAYRVTPLLLLLFIPFFKKYPGFWKRTLLFVIATVIVCVPLGWYFLKHSSDFFGRTSQISVTSSQNPLKDFAANLGKTALMFNFRGDGNWRHNVGDAPELSPLVGILFLTGIALGLRALWKRARDRTFFDENAASLPAFPLLLIFFWLALAALPVAISNEGIPHALRSILMIPGAIMLASIGGVWLYRLAQRSVGRKITQAVALVFLASVAVYGYRQYFIVWAQNPNVAGAFNADYVAIGREINALPPDIPKYVVVDAGGVMTRGIPMPAETVIFITDSFLPEEQAQKNIHYILPEQENTIPPNSKVFRVR